MNSSQLIAHRFKISDLEKDLLGRGGMGTVYRATDTQTGELVAVKALNPEVVAHAPDLVQRFVREGQALRQLNHPNIVSMVAAVQEGGRHYLIMEYVGGGSLADALAAQGRLPGSRVVEIALDLADALARAHRLGIIHRDLKPANVLLAQDGTPRLADFGIAHVESDQRLTQTGVLMGTVDYLSPEVCQGQPPDERADIWAFGVLLFEMLSGRLPFEGTSLTAKITAILTQAVPDLAQLTPDVPDALIDLVYRMLAKDPQQRIPSVRLVGAELEAILKGREVPTLVRLAPGQSRFATPTPIAGPPSWQAKEELVERPVFVARERELAQLDRFLDKALAGQSRVVFVAGEAGQGKTALLQEFAWRALAAHPGLVVAGGTCNAHTGIGDPYLPFREILGLLTGDVEARWAAKAISQEQARRLQHLLPSAVQALVEVGPDLIDLFVPGAALVKRAVACTPWPGGAGWLPRLEELVERKRTVPGDPGLQQSALFEQYTRVLRTLACQRPLLLLLDDLQWVDAASISLLFHLGRRIRENRILIVGAYRPAEVELGRSGERHPLEKVLTEFKRYFGDTWIDLDRTDSAEARQFVDAFLDTEPNRWSVKFREALFHRTNGHPLFTTELLRNMQERGELVRDDQGHWVEGSSLDWTILPTQVEGVIEERIGRLEKQLRDTLTIASVEGEDFTAQVIARVQAVGEKELVLRLSQELDKQHRLVRERGMDHLGDQRLSLYSFRHNLFQSYLYGQLGQAERAYLHEDVGKVLETLYGNQTDHIAVQLARHFEEAGANEKARYYLRRAGELAYRRYAHEEAVCYLNRAFELTSETEYAARFDLLLAKEKVHHIQGARDAQGKDLANLQQLAEAMNDDRARAEAAMRRANYAEATGDYPTAISAVQRGIELANRLTGNSQVTHELLGTGHLIWGTVLRYQYQFSEAQRHLEYALQSFEQISATQQRAVAFRMLGNCFLHQGKYAEAASYFQQSLTLCQEIGDRICGGACLNNLGIVCANLGQHEQSQAYFQQALTILREVGDQRAEAKVLNCLAGLADLLGQYSQATSYAQQALQIHRDVGDRLGERISLVNLGRFICFLGELAEARAYAEGALAVARELGDRHGEAESLSILFYISFHLGEYAQAQTHLEKATVIAQELGVQSLNIGLLADRARLALAQGRLAEAQQDVAGILPQLEDYEDPIGIRLICYKVLQAAGDPQAASILNTAYHLLQEQAMKISNEELRRSFLENVADNQEVVREWEELKCAH